jgi:hypothetical protein
MDPIKVSNDLSFRVGFSGHSGHLRLEPLTTVERPKPQQSIPDFVLVSSVDLFALYLDSIFILLGFCFIFFNTLSLQL